MKHTRLLPAFFFSACLILGTWMGRHMRSNASAAPGVTSHAIEIPTIQSQSTLPGHAAPRPLANGQINLLIIATHSEQLNAILEIIYTENYPSILILPIYPTTSSDETLARSFRLTAANRLDPGFIALLQERNMAWSGYLVLDETATAAVGKAFAPASLETNTPDFLLNSLCQDGQIAPLSADLPTLYHNMQAHIGSDLDLNTLVANWQTQLQNQPAQACEILTPQLSR